MRRYKSIILNILKNLQLRALGIKVVEDNPIRGSMRRRNAQLLLQKRNGAICETILVQLNIAHTVGKLGKRIQDKI